MTHISFILGLTYRTVFNYISISVHDYKFVSNKACVQFMTQIITQTYENYDRRNFCRKKLENVTLSE